MKRSLTCWGLAVFLFSTVNTLFACADDDLTEENTEVQTPSSDEDKGDNEESNDEDDQDDNNDNQSASMERNITISVNGTSFSATLENNNATRAFAAMLPLTLNMNEMNGNEKYHYLSANLPVDSYRPGTIRAGDLMLYGSSCVVLFYETFPSGYAYTRLGQIDNPEGLDAALGRGNVSVRFAIAENPD